jgi:aspartate kinase
MKFGGSAVSTTAALTQVVSIVLQERERWDQLILVVSALEGVTDSLLEAAHLAQLSNRRGYRRVVANIRTRHLALVEKLPFSTNERNALQADIDNLLFDMLDVCQTMADNMAETVPPQTLDAITSVGERLSARIVAALLRQKSLRGVAIDTIDLIITDDIFGNATPDIPETRLRIRQHLLPMLERKIIPVCTGYIAGTPGGKITTLGRGGSDLTASLLSVYTDSEEVWVWADVDGLMSTDPHEFPDAFVIPELSYEEAAELAYFGARILHARMILPIREANIPLRIKNVYKPQLQGTIVHSRAQTSTQKIKAVTAIHGVSLSADHNGPLHAITEIANDVLFQSIGAHADVTITSQSASRSLICLVIPTSAGPDAIHTTSVALQKTLQANPKTAEWDVTPVGIITAIGANINQRPRLTAALFEALDDIYVLALSQGPSNANLSVVVAQDDLETALYRVHNLTLMD